MKRRILKNCGANNAGGGSATDMSAADVSCTQSDTDLVRSYIRYLSCENQERSADILELFIRYIDRRIGYLVHCKRLYPIDAAPNTFSADASSRAHCKFHTEIHTLRNPRAFVTWMNKLVYCSIIEEVRERTRRLKNGPCLYIPLEIELADGSIVSVLDQSDSRDAARRNGIIARDEAQIVKELVYRDIVRKLFRADVIVSDADREAIKWLELKYMRDLTTTDLASAIGREPDEVSRRLRAVMNKLRDISIKRYGFTAKDL